MRRHLASHAVRVITGKMKRVSIAPDEPRSLYIELTNRCNYRCPICPLTTSKRAKKDMDFSIFKKIIDDMRIWNSHRTSLALHVFGEPFLYKQIFDCFDYIEDSLRECKIYISTNFSVVTRPQIERLFYPRAHNVDIGLWIDAFSAETYGKQRGESHCYQKVMENIDYLIELKQRYASQRPQFHIGMILTRNNQHEEKEFIEYWKERLKGLKGVDIITRVSHDWSGQISGNEVLLKKRGPFSYRNICTMPFGSMVVFSNGDVGLCCYDVDHQITVGNVTQDYLKDIWSSSEAEAFRESMRSFALDSFPLCGNCMQYNKSFLHLFQRIFAMIFRKDSWESSIEI